MLNQLQCLSLMGALLVLVAQPAKAQESSDQIDKKVAVTDKEFALLKAGVVIAKSPVDLFRSTKPQLKRSQSASLPQRAKSDEASKNIS
ncbi:MAG: hypothetical protein KME49_20265 [Brasilonema octagenarum HA4186-MV1]|nr:hypothetical protein [Brasilonema octagenarum HA4186-MV1]